MKIIYTCPKCGHDLIDLVLTSNPPQCKKECFSCGWASEIEQEEIVRVPFGGNSLNGGSGNCNCILGDFGLTI